MTNINSKVNIPEQVTFREVSGEMVLLNLESGKYFGLDEVGARMYALLAEDGCLEAAYQTLLEEYEVDPERLQSDLIALVEDLAEHGLLHVLEA